MLISAGGIITGSIQLYRNNFKQIIIYALLMLIPSVIIGLGGLSLGVLLLALDSITIAFTIYAILLILGSVISFWFSIGLIRIIGHIYENKPTPTLIENLKLSTKLIVPGIIASILAGLAIIGGFILLIIPGIIFAIWFAFIMQAIVFDDKHGPDALSLSKSLSAGRWFRVFWRILAPVIVFGIAYSIIQWIAMTLLIAIASDTFIIGVTLYTIIMVAFSLIFIPLTYTVPTILYLELKKNPIIPTPEPAITTEPPQD